MQNINILHFYCFLKKTKITYYYSVTLLVRSSLDELGLYVAHKLK